MKNKSNWQYAIRNMQIVHCLSSTVNRQLPFTNRKLRIVSYILPVAICLLLIQSCNNGTKEQTQDENTKVNQPATTQQVELNRAQIKTAGILLGTFKRDTISTTVEANGYIELLPNNRATINPPVNGFIQKINCIEGEPVKEGHVLFLLKHPDIIELQKKYIQALNEFNVAQQEVDRQKILSEANVSARKQYQQAFASFQTAKAQKNAIAEQLLFIGINPEDTERGKISNTISVVAPFTGIVSKVFSHYGQLVNTTETVVELINADKLLLKINVFEQDVNKIMANQKLNFTIPSFNNAKVYHGIVSYVGKNLDMETRTIQVTSILSDYPDLIPGIYAEAKIFSNPGIDIVLPDEAIVKDADGEFVFRLVSDSAKTDNSDELTFKKMEVKTGSSENGFTEILNANLFPDQSTFVTKGAFYLKSEMGKGEIDDD
ncbi:MAG TPA: efflux RND transporter periplasmic adaptor subunit [Bacteroidales bacterium]|nr:efflux RND transporter periplasmic adaptor subunit [Bacteroidales bacterium]